MNKIVLKRGRGKTTYLVCRSNVTGFPILTATSAEKEYIIKLAKGLKLKIPEPICLMDIKQGRVRGKKIKDVLVDDFDIVFYNLLKEHTMSLGVELTASEVTMSKD